MLSVSVGKLRRWVMNGGPIAHVLPQVTSTSLEGFGGVLPPPMTDIAGRQGTPVMTALSARVSAVGRGILGMVVMQSAIGSYLNESFVSTSVVPFQSLPPAV